MKVYLLLFFSAFLSALIAQDSIYLGKYPPTEVPDRINLSWNGDPATSMAVTWRTSQQIKVGHAEIKIADASPYFSNTDTIIATTGNYTSDQNTANYHSVSFTDLQPNTLYAYRVGALGSEWSEWSHFKTADQQEKPFSFIYLGDAQNDLKSRWSRTIREAFKHLPRADFILHAGDLVNLPHADDEWGEWFYAAGWIYRTIPSIPTPGNHEYLKNDDGTRSLCGHWRPTFTLPENGPDGLKETTYYIDYQGARIISLNAPDFVYNDNLDSIQVKWLENTLKSNTQKWTIVTLHHPIFSPAISRDNPDLRAAFQPLFDKFGVDFVLQGHDHSYGRGGNNLPEGATIIDSTGPVYVVSVSGPKMYASNMASWMDRAAHDLQLFQIIKVNGQVLTFQAYTTTGELYDKFQLVKKQDHTNLFVDLAPGEMPDRLGSFPESPLFKKMSAKEMEVWQAKFEKFKAKRKLTIPFQEED